MKENIKVIKVPNKVTSPVRPISFPSMPRLYLELIENKNKVLQSVVNEDYVPSNVNNYNQYQQQKLLSPKKENIVNSPKLRNSPKENVEIDNDSDNYSSSDDSDASSDDEKSLYGDDSVKSTHSNNLGDRLNELLEDNNTSENFDIKKSPPTLKELEERGAVERNQHIPDISREFVANQNEEDLKRELLFKFELLKKSYKDNSIPEYSIHSDYKSMQHSYESTVRRLSLDSTVENYKTYLIGGFMLVEFVLGKFLKFDMQGFTQQQIMNMTSYERLLIELGEKSYVPGGSDWPIEIRLIFLIIINAGFFVVSRMMMKSTGTNILNMMNSMNVNNRPSQVHSKRKMKGPDIDFEVFPEDQ
tara:strand:- start:797 stop:1873 length:1077 start_codon:yes stop_codon:yes gene_type:complete